MAKTLILKDGSTLEITDLSTIYNIQTVVENFAAIDELALKLTEDSLAGAEIDEEKYENIIPNGIKAESDVNGNVVATFLNRDKTIDEIQNEKIDDLQNTVIELLDGDEPIDDGEDVEGE